MSLRELDEHQLGLSRAQLTNSLVIVFVAVGMMLVGVLMRNAARAATTAYLDEDSGIRVHIPAGWLLTTDSPDFVLQAEDPNAIPFKTTLRVAVIPVSRETSSRNVIDSLILQRSASLSTFRVGSIEITSFGEDAALEMDYAYVQSEANPFLNAVPLVVQGRDLVVVRGQQALVVSYLEQRSRFEDNGFLFDNFLARLEF